ncbi:hypothetical protein BU17DRAFT_48729 [Hysterangium stoloniferum]|nr:hypothetical protein BU17DRAFT_48729 [Hysterangium stoloniferum]
MSSSPSKSHWNQLRNAIIPSTTTSTSRINAATLPSSNNLPQAATPLPRSQTPKPSRLARLGFRQVVDQTREVVQDETGRFEADIYQACNSARFGQVRSKAGSQSSYRPFMSSASLPLSVNASTTQLNKPVQMNETSVQASPSLRLLHQTLVRYTPSSGLGPSISRLPFESEVLSVLLLPFLNNAGYEAEEQWLAIESFEIAVTTWTASSKQREVDRVLWCCKAGLTPPSPVRSRVLATLSTLLFSSTPVQLASTLAFQNIMQGLYQLLHAFDKFDHSPSADVKVVGELCVHVSTGGCGQPEVKDIESEYEAQWISDDTEASVRSQIIAEGMVRCMHIGSEGVRRWMLNAIEVRWPMLPSHLTPLCVKIVNRRLVAFFRSSISLLRSDKAPNQRNALLESDANTILLILERHALSEIDQLPLERETTNARILVVELVLQLLRVGSPFQRQQVAELLCNWYHHADGQRTQLLSALSHIVEKVDWSHLVPMLQSVVDNIPEEERKELISIILSSIHKRLVVDPISTISKNVTALFQSLADLYPQQFYKPLFSLATAVKDPTLVAHFSVVTAVARHLPDFWIRDSEMMAIALMSGVGKTGPSQASGDQPISWAKLRVGQSLIALELIRRIRQLTKEKKDTLSPPDSSQVEALLFATGLDSRLAVLLEAKEKTGLVPLSQRILLSVLLLEIRLFTRSLKPALWLPTVIAWATQGYVGAELQTESSPFSDEPEISSQGVVTEEDFKEVLSTMRRLQSIHIASWQMPTSHSRQRSTMALSIITDPVLSAGIVDFTEVHSESIKERSQLMALLPTTVSSAALRLLVAVCGLLGIDEHRKLAPVLWSNYLDSEDPNIVEPACFLFMHCLEKSARENLISFCRSADNMAKRNIIRRLMTLFSWRFQISTQTYISDKVRRRPFKLARLPLAFVAIDAGSSTYVHEQTEEDRKNLPGGSLPFELRRRLAEFGWEQDDEPTDTKMEKIRAPMSLFSPSQLDQINGPRDQGTTSASKSTEKLLRRKSSGASSHHGRGGKRRPVFVPALVTLFCSMALMTTDADPFVAAAAREALLVMLRDDPAMICRPIMEILSTDLRRVGEVVTILRAFLHVHHRLPPSASHHIFGNLGGFLKHISRDSDDSNVFGAFASTAPILAKLITQVSNLNIRDLRRSKFEIYVFPSGSLWFPPTAPASPMFPRSLDHGSYRRDEIPDQLVNICMIRTAQNMLFLDMLKHKPQEVLAIRKSMIGLVLPGENTGKNLDANSFLPRRNDRKGRRTSYQQVSLALSRSHLLLLGQVFRSMPRNFSGKAELTSLFDGLNRILIAHGDDVGIVAHALIACMIGITRFKRFLASNRGFAFFMPSLLKVYAEAEGRTSICQAIQYASSRFYAIHEEGYVFQSLDLASKILVRIKKSEDKDWFAQKIWLLFSALKSPIHSSTPDAAGIRGCNRAEECEALIATTVMDDMSLSAVQESPQGEQLKKILAIGEYESKVLQLDDFVKLFLTVIAHDTTIIRAQNFLSLFRRMVPNFYRELKSDVLREGIGAIGPALFPKTSRQKGPESAPGRPVQLNGPERPSMETQRQTEHFEDESSACDPLIMRREYLSMIVSFVQMGGDLRQSTIRRALETVKGLLKESTRPEPEVEGTFLDEFTKAGLYPLSATPKHALSLLQEIVPVIRAFALTIDWSGVLDTITNFMRRTEVSRNDTFVRFVVEEVASPLLQTCQDAASENMLMSLPMRRSLLSLISHTATFGNADVAGIIEKQTPSPAFLSGIVLPLCMKIKTSAEIAIENQMQSKTQAARHGFVFLRILGYVIDACRLKTDPESGRASPSPGLTRRESERSKASTTTNRTLLATMSIAIQIIKVIVYRAADDISIGLVGIWARLAQFLKHLLADGNAQFALASIVSPSPSPWQSPTLGPALAHWSERQSLSSDHARPSSSQSCSPRVVDYLTWSLLEFLCCAPSALNLQMRLWMQERMHNLDVELKAREVRTSSLVRGSRRLSTSVFARPRGSSASPDALRASNTFSRIPSDLNLSASLPSDYSIHPRFPPSPASLQPSRPGPRIIHLGPTKDHPAFNVPLERSSSMDSHLKSLARKTYIALPILARMTEDRIRVVQVCMGYDRLLPLEGQGNDPADINLKAWTKASTLVMLAEETKLLMDEFPENFHDIVGGGFVDVPANVGAADTPFDSPMKKPVLF